MIWQRLRLPIERPFGIPSVSPVRGGRLPVFVVDGALPPVPPPLAPPPPPPPPPMGMGCMRFGFGWSLHGADEARARYRSLHADRRPLLVCANHLTMVDSALIAWALGSPLWYLRHFAAVPWNTPERRNFASSPVQRALVWLMKCVPIERGGDRAARSSRTLAQE